MARKEATFTMNVESGTSVKDLRDLDKTMDELNQSAKDTKKTLSDTSGLDKFEKELQELDALIESGTLDMRQMTKVIQDYQTIAFRAGANSPVGAKAINQASELKDRITDLNNRVKQGASDYAKMDAALQGAGAAMAGFQAFQGVAALMGDENEELLKTIVKLQAGMTVLNSIQQIRNALNKDSALTQQFEALQMRIRTKETVAQTAAQKVANAVLGEGTKASKTFSKALVATGIGALVAGIALLVANWDKLKVALGGATKAQEAANASMDKAIEAAAEELSALDKLGDTINDENVSREDKTKAIKTLQEQYPNLLANVDAEKSSLEEVNKALELNAELTLLKAQADAIAELRTEEFKKQIKAQTDAQSGANESFSSWVLSFSDAEAAQAAHILQQKEISDESQKQIDIYDDLDKSIQDQISSLRELGATDEQTASTQTKNADNRKARLDELRRQEEELNAAQRGWIAEENELLNLIAQTKEEFNTSEQQRELNAVNEKYFLLITRAEEFGIESATLKEAQEAELVAIEDKYNQISIDNKRKEIEAKAALEQEAIDLRIDAMVEGEAKEIAQLQESFKARQAALAESEALSAQEKLPLKLALEEQEQMALAEIRDRYREEEKAKDAELQQGKINSANNYLNVATDILSTIASFQEASTAKELNSIDTEFDAKLKAAEGDAVLTERLERQKDAKKTAIEKKAFERSKKMQIAMAVIQGIQGVMAAFTAGSSMGPAGVVMGPLMAALAAAGAIANIAKISATKFEGGGSASGASSAYSGSGAATGASASSFAVSDDTSSAQTAINPDGTVSAQGQQPIKVFVSETDISGTQADVEEIDMKSTF